MKQFTTVFWISVFLIIFFLLISSVENKRRKQKMDDEIVCTLKKKKKNRSFRYSKYSEYMFPEMLNETNFEDEDYERNFTKYFRKKYFEHSHENFDEFVEDIQKYTTMRSTRSSVHNYRKQFGKFAISNFQKHSKYLVKQMLNKTKKSLCEKHGPIHLFSTVLNSEKKEIVFTAPFNHTDQNKEFIKLEVTNIAEEDSHVSRLIYYDDVDFLDENGTLKDFVLDNDTLIAPNLNDTGAMGRRTARFKNSDMFSINLDAKKHLIVKFKLKSYQQDETPNWLLHTEEECGFLDENTTWAWSTNGCKRVKGDDNEYYCECTHLSNFALLFSVRVINEHHLVAFQILSIIAGVVSIVSLFLFLLFMFLINHRDKLQLDQLNIALCLLLATILFMLGIVTSKHPMVCTVAAAVTQFLYLAAFFWKLVLGINVVRMLASLRFQEDWLVKYRIPIIVLAYILPLFISVLSVCLYPKFYKEVSENVCWIQAPSPAFLTFLIPIGVIVGLNIIALFYIGIVLIQNYMRMKKTKVNKSNELLVFLQLSMTMGLTWFPSYLATQYIIAMYIMIIAYPFQGLLMFLLVVVVNKENREKVSSFVQKTYSSITSKSTLDKDSRSQSKYKSESDTKESELNLSLLSNQTKSSLSTEKRKHPLVTVKEETRHSDSSV